MIWSGRDLAIAASEQEVLGRSDEIAREHDLVGRLGTRPFSLGGIVEQQRDGAVAFEQRQSLPFDNAEIAAVAQVIGVPVVAVEEELVDRRDLHRVAQIIDPRAIRSRDGQPACGVRHGTNP